MKKYCASCGYGNEYFTVKPTSCIRCKSDLNDQFNDANEASITENVTPKTKQYVEIKELKFDIQVEASNKNSHKFGEVVGTGGDTSYKRGKQFRNTKDALNYYKDAAAGRAKLIEPTEE